jgi:hypothetical protein
MSREAAGFASGHRLLSMLTMRRPFLLASVAIVAVTVGFLLLMGRPPICTCGTITLWGPVGPTQSQMIADWYSPSHFIHGLIFYFFLWLLFRSWSVERRFLVALGVESLWEVVENTPLIIDRYREATMALGYNGDSMLNSLSDIAMMAIGFFAAQRLPVWVSIVIAFGFELLTLAVIRDNLALNVWMLLFPSDAIRIWQAGA